MSTRRVRVLVADDSVIFRQALTSILTAEPAIELMAAVKNGREAVTWLRTHTADVVVMDVEMPELDGLGALRELRAARCPAKVIMFSTLTQRGSRAAVEAITSGAVDCVAKPEGLGHLSASIERIRAELLPRIKSIAASGHDASPPVSPSPAPRRLVTPRLIVVGASTGGPNALFELLQALPEELDTPIAIAQHMPPGFTRMLAERLAVAARRPVIEASHDARLSPGAIVLAPGDQHLEVFATGATLRTRLSRAAPINQVRPSVDVLFASAASATGAATLAVVLSGMGRDGADGALALAKAGAYVMVQDEASSVVWGMPGAVARAGAAHQIAPIPQLARALGSAQRTQSVAIRTLIGDIA